MVCIYCNSKTEITNSRRLARSNATWRRRHCLKCGALYTTVEEADYSRLWLIAGLKGRLSPFLRDKLFLSVYDSLRHRKTAIQDASALTSTIIAKIAKASTDGQIDRQKLIDTALACLKRFDKTAAVHYKAYYDRKPS